MYHTFQVPPTATPHPSHTATGAETTVSQHHPRISTPIACRECRRKKTRCGGGQPCQQCTATQRPELCSYAKIGRRAMPSRRLVDKLQSELDALSHLCSRLFPGHDPHALLALSKEQLYELVLSLRTGHSNHASPFHKTPDSAADSIASDSLIALEQAPEMDPTGDEASKRGMALQNISDDVNGLALSVSAPSSYVGVSSISAALKVIFKIAPQVQSYLAEGHTRTALPSRASSPTVDDALSKDMDQYILPPPDVAQAHIESYLKHVHVLVPMFDEDQFRHAYLYDGRKDAPWLALLNVVLALGSLTSGTSDNEEHLIYSRRASSILRYKSFGSGNLMVLQAHGLLSGYYMHWLNRPNEANACMGATMRMATAIGLHREYGVPNNGSRTEIPSDIRRRTWYSLVCLDTWACMTTGRPSFGRVGPGITVRPPELPQTTNNAQYLASLKLLPLIHNITFCTLATHIQDSLATKPLLSIDELMTRDAELVNWHEKLPPMLRDIVSKQIDKSSPDSGQSAHTYGTRNFSDRISSHGANRPGVERHASFSSCPDVLKTPRALMHWWYFTIRILMHRPYLTSAALRRMRDSELNAQERFAVEKCRALAGEAIMTIDETCRRELVAGWNAVWLMYQAVMVPLISLFTFVSIQRSDIKDKGQKIVLSPEAEQWHMQIVTAIHFFGRMSAFSLAATRSKIVVEQLLEASKNPSSYDTTSPMASRPEDLHTGNGGYQQSQSSAATMPPPSQMAGPSQPLQGEYSTFDSWDFAGNSEDLDLIWDEMNWERVSEKLDILPFADFHAGSLDGAFGPGDAFL